MFTVTDTIDELNRQGYDVEAFSEYDLDIATRLMNEQSLFDFTPDQVKRGRELGMFF